jgi:hypothetical protein
MSELKYLNPTHRDRFVADLRRDVPAVKVEYHCFKNDPEIANSNFVCAETKR